MQVERDKHIVVGGHGAVAAHAKQQVHAELPPLQTVHILVDNLAVGAVGVGGAVDEKRRVVEGFHNHVAGAGGAVVAEKIVDVVLVLGTAVLLQGIEKTAAFVGGEAQALLHQRAALVLVGGHKIAVAGGRHAVVEVPSDEIPVQVGRVEIEGAVVVHTVDAVGGVAHTYGGVPEG